MSQIKKDYKIIKMNAKYLEGKAWVHYHTWDISYRGLIDDEFLNNRTYEKSLSRISSSLNDSNIFCDIALIKDKVVGFVQYNKDRDGTNTGEIAAIYVLPEYQGRGIGTALLNTAVRALTKEYKTIYLWVLSTNQKSISFYEQNGFVLEDVQKIEKFLTTTLNVSRMVYQSV